MSLHEWLRRRFRTDVLRFNHLLVYLDASPYEIEDHLDGYDPFIKKALKSLDGVEGHRVIEELNQHLLQRFTRRKKRIQVTLEVELELPDSVVNFGQKEKQQVIERIATHMNDQGLAHWRIVRMQKG